ncbi:MAG: L-histidine N(alpha)-methyltransferase [Acidobacteria bacterium]|nr:L-histidine N(alpha)-methyltransferase [Acidobacteriota bacterium]MDW7983355.1 L-histidine N(alpha)-methyltransferase [Acidobacteriota bacterium]
MEHRRLAGGSGGVPLRGGPMAMGQVGSRFRLIEVLGPEQALARLAQDVRAGLTATPKYLPCRYFYDDEGCRLFQAICELPEYYLTRTEQAILEAYVESILQPLPPSVVLIELGSGDARKTRVLLEALIRRQKSLLYVPIDISRTALVESAHRLLQAYPSLEVTAVAAEYDDGLPYIAEVAGDPPKLILWLGSSIGNFDPPEAVAFLRRVRQVLTPEDVFLVGMDLHKDRAVLEPAYDDPQGVTARFNRNLLVRINRELGGHFDVTAFRHRVVYDEVRRRIEMYLVSAWDQRVVIEALALEVLFAADEAIHTENSYKYTFEDIDAIAGAAGFRRVGQWLDDRRYFSVNLFRLTE